MTGNTPLMYAAMENKLSMVDRMLDLGCDINAKNKVSCYSNTFIQYSIRVHIPYCVQYSTVQYIREKMENFQHATTIVITAGCRLYCVLHSHAINFFLPTFFPPHYLGTLHNAALGLHVLKGGHHQTVAAAEGRSINSGRGECALHSGTIIIPHQNAFYVRSPRTRAACIWCARGRRRRRCKSSRRCCRWRPRTLEPPRTP